MDHVKTLLCSWFLNPNRFYLISPYFSVLPWNAHLLSWSFLWTSEVSSFQRIWRSRVPVHVPSSFWVSRNWQVCQWNERIVPIPIMEGRFVYYSWSTLIVVRTTDQVPYRIACAAICMFDSSWDGQRIWWVSQNKMAIMDGWCDCVVLIQYKIVQGDNTVYNCFWLDEQLL